MKSALGGKFCRLTSVIPGKGRQPGFTLFELVGVILIASALGLVLFDRLLFYRAQAEQTVMEMTVINMRSGLRLRVAELMIRDRMSEAGSLVHENPIHWLAAPPPNYLGTLQNPEQNAIPGNAWYFDTSRHELVYMPGRDNIFGLGPIKKAVRFRVTAIERPPVQGGGSVPKVEGITLVRVDRQDEQ